MNDEQVCRCELCLAMLELAESAVRNLRRKRAERKLHVVVDVDRPKGGKRVAA